MRYFTPLSLKMDKSSLKSGYIREPAFQAVSLARNFTDGGEAFMVGTLSPIGVFLGLHGVQAVIAFDRKACFSVHHARGAPYESRSCNYREESAFAYHLDDPPAMAGDDRRRLAA